MEPETLFALAGRIRGIHGYALVGRQGCVTAHNMGASENLFRMIYACGRELVSLGGRKFRYASFARTGKGTILVFPFGDFFLGVVTQGDDKDSNLAREIMAVLQHQD